jgi:cyclohexanone monooxygenase
MSDAPLQADVDVDVEDDVDVDVVVIGAGFAGLYMLHRLRGAGFSTVVIERGSGVGGTWYWNRYPGARCDTESVDYSYSFSPELEQEWVWTERYPGQPEILRYIEHVADRFDLRRDICFDTSVVGAVVDEATGRWTVATDDGDARRCRFLVTAVGVLSTPKEPELAGLERFAGNVWSTARWPHDGVDFTGRRVGVIGTGSSGIQSIPMIAAEAEHLSVFQRTANFSLPARNRPLDPGVLDAIKAGYRQRRAFARRSFVGIPRASPERSAFDDPPEVRAATYAAGFDDGSLNGVLGAYTDLLSDRAANETAAEYVRERIRAMVDDPVVAAALVPTEYPIGAKRLCLDTDYFATYNRDDVSLVDLRATPIVEITEAGIRTTDAEHELDDIVLATGFDAVTGSLLKLDVRSATTTLRDRWSAGPRSYLGIAVSGFPNLFTITGPGSPSVVSNVIVAIEQHVEWITDLLVTARASGTTRIEAAADAEDDWVGHVNHLADETLYPAANSWYLGANVPGKPRVFLAYVGGIGRYQEVLDDVAAAGYRGFDMTG